MLKRPPWDANFSQVSHDMEMKPSQMVGDYVSFGKEMA